jgi:hypothetical protein
MTAAQHIAIDAMPGRAAYRLNASPLLGDQALDI